MTLFRGRLFDGFLAQELKSRKYSCGRGWTHCFSPTSDETLCSTWCTAWWETDRSDIRVYSDRFWKSLKFHFTFFVIIFKFIRATRGESSRLGIRSPYLSVKIETMFEKSYIKGTRMFVVLWMSYYFWCWNTEITCLWF